MENIILSKPKRLDGKGSIKCYEQTREKNGQRGFQLEWKE